MIKMICPKCKIILDEFIFMIEGKYYKSFECPICGYEFTAKEELICIE